LASIIKRGKTYSVVFYAKDEEGVSKQVWESGLSHKEAKARKLEIESRKLDGTFANPTKLTVGAYLEEWLSYYKKKGNAYSTCTMVEGILRNHIIPTFGEKKLQELTSKEAEDFFLDLKQTRHAKGNYRYTLYSDNELPFLSKNTIRHIYIYFNMALNKAVEWKYIAGNPITFDPPESESNHRVAWDEETLLAALDEVKDPMLHLCLHLAFVGSMRSGEISGLTWDCVNWQEENMTINKIVQRVKKRDLDYSPDNPPLLVFPNAIGTRETDDIKSCLILKGPKTPKSRRAIYMTGPLKQELLKRWQLVSKRMAVLDEEYHNHNLVVCLEDGRPVEPKLIAKWFKLFIKKHGGVFPDVTLHSLRATSTTYKLVLSHGDIKAVQGDTGHANAKMVTDIYAKIQDKNRKKMAQALEKDFYKNQPAQTTPAIKSEVDVANHMLLLKKLVENPQGLEILLATLGQPVENHPSASECGISKVLAND